MSEIQTYQNVCNGAVVKAELFTGKPATASNMQQHFIDNRFPHSVLQYEDKIFYYYGAKKINIISYNEYVVYLENGDVEILNFDYFNNIFKLQTIDQNELVKTYVSIATGYDYKGVKYNGNNASQILKLLALLENSNVFVKQSIAGDNELIISTIGKGVAHLKLNSYLLVGEPSNINVYCESRLKEKFM